MVLNVVNVVVVEADLLEKLCVGFLFTGMFHMLYYARTILAFYQHAVWMVGYVYATIVAAVGEEHIVDVSLSFRWSRVRRETLLDNA